MRGIGVLALVGAGWWLLSKRKAGAAILPIGEDAAFVQAKALLADPEQAIAENEAFAAAYPTAYNMIEQANIQIASGGASAEDMVRFEVDKAFFAKYVAEGGVATYEDFTLSSTYWTPEYEEAKQKVEDQATQIYVAEVEAGGTHYIEHMLGILSGSLYEALAARHPELAAKVKAEEAGEIVLKVFVDEVTVPTGFTPEEGFAATVEQLDKLEASGHESGSSSYEAAVDASYEAAAASCGSGETVSWSSSGGYESVSASEAWGDADYW